MKPSMVYIFCLMSLVYASPTSNRGKQLEERDDEGTERQLPDDEGTERQVPEARQFDGEQKPMNYDFVWNVDNEEDASYYGHKEGAENGRVQGTYYNMLPDGRLMRVDYYVDGESGFVPTITFEGEYSPNWGADFFV